MVGCPGKWASIILKSIANGVPGAGNRSSVVKAPPAAASDDIFRNCPRRNLTPGFKLRSALDQLRRRGNRPAGQPARGTGHPDLGQRNTLGVRGVGNRAIHKHQRTVVGNEENRIERSIAKYRSGGAYNS